MAMKPDRIELDLVDQDGGAFTIGHLAGCRSLVYFGFLHCRGVCPRSLAKLADIMAGLGPARDGFRVLYITVDPERDTPEAMKTFLSARYPDFTGLTGPRPAIDRAKASMKAFARRAEDPDDPDGYAMPHTALIYLIDDQGRYLAHFPDTCDAATIVNRLTAATPPF
ncbi:SCO family protein [Niveispirillum sp.]|uniref:SCO family protein n=1 Tax=Niveispirillum sp. TaxID=1917217 RepID=UPI001B7869A1|nr:SCO family protein [Niveispirillum sp.]MBP7338911.1 SCO family protein [Niveispirillum sp.]